MDKENKAGKLIPVRQLENVRVFGRRCRAEESGAADPNAPVTLWWAGSGVEFDFNGEAVSIGFEADWDYFNPWVSVELDGVLVSRFPVSRGKSQVQLFAQMNPGQQRSWHVRVLRETEPQPGDDRQLLRVTGLAGKGGDFLPLRPVHRRIEFVGDSITAGEGAIGQKHDNDWAPVFFSAWNSYPRMVGEALDANFREVAISGWGIRSAWNNQRSARIPRIYGKVCGALTGEEQTRLGSQQPADFDDWQPDVVCVNLGTNDASAFHQPPFTDPVTGQAFKEHVQANGTPDPHDLELLAEDLRSFLAELRQDHPTALIVDCFGMISPEFVPFFKKVVEDYTRQTHDSRMLFFQLPAMKPEWVGSHEHPGPIAHREAARALTAFLSQKMGWQAGKINDDLTVDSRATRPKFPPKV